MYYYLIQAYDDISWPTCEITHCINLTQVDGFKVNVTAEEDPDSDKWVEVGQIVAYECAIEGQVVDNASLSLVSECLSSGEFTPITDWPGCRAALSCNEFPVPEQATTFLLPTESTEVLEFGYAYYECQEGAQLDNADNSQDIVDGKFRLICGANGVVNMEPEWPVCTVESCINVLVKDGYVNTTALPVSVGAFVPYRCADDNEVFDNSYTIPIPCQNNGLLLDLPEWPACRTAKTCTSVPEPTIESKLKSSNSDTVLEFRSARYLCKGDGIIEATNKTYFDVGCLKSAQFKLSGKEQMSRQL